MNNIQGADSRRSFFPNAKGTQKAGTSKSIEKMLAKRNDPERKKELDTLGQANAKVDINTKIKDFARIKKAVDMAPEVDNSEKIASLRQRIKSGQYQVNYDALADKMLAGEF